MDAHGGLDIGIDVGTSTVSLAAWDARARRLVRSVTVANDAGLDAVAPRHEQDPRRIEAAVGKALAELASLGARPARAAACTGQMHGLLLLDERLEPVSPLYTWQDGRAGAQAARANAALDRADPRGWLGRGCRIHPGYGAATLLWLLDNGGLPRGTRWASTVADWIAARLCGRLATDPSGAASWGIGSLDRRDWDEEAVRVLGLPREILPPVREPGTPLGDADLGALGRVKVACGLGDNQASVLAASSVAPGRDCAVANVGTGSQLSVVAAASAGIGGLEVRPFVDGKVLCVGASLNGGAAYALLRRLFFDPAAASVRGEEPYAQMNRWAAAVRPGCDGLRCEPAFYGERGDEGLAGSFSGIGPSNFTAGHMCRAVLEGMARKLHEYYRASGVRTDVLLGSGNAVRKNELLREILAATFGAKLEVSPYTEEAAVGAALLAASRQPTSWPDP